MAALLQRAVASNATFLLVDSFKGGSGDGALAFGTGHRTGHGMDPRDAHVSSSLCRDVLSHDLNLCCVVQCTP